MTHPSMPTAGGGGGGGAPPAAACAACKYQRRRCTADCPLAQYFPQERPRVFRNAHRLFGVSNILKTLKRVGPDPGRRHEAMQCIVYESQAWDLYPAAGCVPIILALQQRIQQTEHELRRVHADLQAIRFSSAEATSSSSSSSPPAPPPFQLPFMYGGGGDEQQEQMMAMLTNNNADIIAPQTLPWMTTVQPPTQSYEEHPFFVNAATTMVPQFHYEQEQQPIVDSTQLMPELQDDMINYFADVGINNGGENDDKMMMPRRQSSTDSSDDDKAMKKAPS